MQKLFLTLILFSMSMIFFPAHAIDVQYGSYSSQTQDDSINDNRPPATTPDIGGYPPPPPRRNWDYDNLSSTYSYIYNKLKYCHNAYMNVTGGEILVRKLKNGACRFDYNVNGKAMTCAFPKTAAEKYARYKNKTSLTNSQYTEMKTIENRYCR